MASVGMTAGARPAADVAADLAVIFATVDPAGRYGGRVRVAVPAGGPVAGARRSARMAHPALWAALAVVVGGAGGMMALGPVRHPAPPRVAAVPPAAVASPAAMAAIAPAAAPHPVSGTRSAAVVRPASIERVAVRMAAAPAPAVLHDAAEPSPCAAGMAVGRCARRAVLTADRTLRVAYAAAIDAGVGRRQLIQVRNDWAELSAEEYDRPAVLLRGYAALARELRRLAAAEDGVYG